MTGGFVAAVVAVVLLILVATPEYDRPAAAVAAGAPESSPTPVARATSPVDTTGGPDSLPPEELTGYHWPLRAARVLTWFGPNKQGFIKTDDGRIHEGIALASRCDAPVTAAHKGTVVATGRAVLGEVGFEASRAEITELEQKHISRSGMGSAGGGKDDLPITVVIDDGNGYRSLYKHLGEVAVKPGQKVKTSTVIGTTGQSGGVTRCQVQYELVRMDGEGWQRVAQEEIERMGYPKWILERVDPLRVLSLDVKGAPKPTRRGPPPAAATGAGSAAATGAGSAAATSSPATTEPAPEVESAG